MSNRYPERGIFGFARFRKYPAGLSPWIRIGGRVHAIVGGFSFDQSQFNRATQARRQPGSAYKPFVYATALDNGYTPSTIVLDGPITIENAGSDSWSPTNYDNSFAGPRTLRYGIEILKEPDDGSARAEMSACR